MREMRELRKKTEGDKPKVQEQAPVLYPDLVWIWGAFCSLSNHRGVAANGPVPITLESIEAYLRLSNRYEFPYNQQVLRFIPALDRYYLQVFYENQQKEMEQIRKKAESASRSSRNRR